MFAWFLLRYSVILVLCLLSVLLVLAPSPGGNTGNGAAVVNEDGTCNITGSYIGYPGPIFLDNHQVLTPSDQSKITCQGRVPDGFEPEHTLDVQIQCSTRFGTGPGRFLVTPSGQAHIFCRISPG